MFHNCPPERVPVPVFPRRFLGICVFRNMRNTLPVSFQEAVYSVFNVGRGKDSLPLSHVTEKRGKNEVVSQATMKNISTSNIDWLFVSRDSSAES